MAGWSTTEGYKEPGIYFDLFLSALIYLYLLIRKKCSSLTTCCVSVDYMIPNIITSTQVKRD